jgi:hypothetical protein
VQDHRPTATRVGVKARDRANAGIADEDIEPAVAVTGECYERREIGTPCHVCDGKTRFPARARDAVGQHFEPIQAAHTLLIDRFRDRPIGATPAGSAGGSAGARQ